MDTADCAHVNLMECALWVPVPCPAVNFKTDPLFPCRFSLRQASGSPEPRRALQHLSGPAEAYLDASKKEETRLDIIVEGLFRSNEGWRFDIKGLASPHVLWNGMQPTPLFLTGQSHHEHAPQRAKCTMADSRPAEVRIAAFTSQGWLSTAHAAIATSKGRQ